MRFVKTITAAAALVCSGLTGQAHAAWITTFGTATADDTGYFSIPLEMTKLGGAYRVRFYFETPFAVTSQITGTIVEKQYTPPWRGFELKQMLVLPFASDLKTTNYLEAFEIAGSYAWWRRRSDTWSVFTSPVAVLNVYTDPGATVPYAFTSAPVPEPSTWALLILGMGAIGTAIRRRQTSSARIGHSATEGLERSG